VHLSCEYWTFSICILSKEYSKFFTFTVSHGFSISNGYFILTIILDSFLGSLLSFTNCIA